MRDPETASLTLTAAETGRIALSTLNTRDTRSTITRIIDMFPAERTEEVAIQLSLSGCTTPYAADYLLAWAADASST